MNRDKDLHEIINDVMQLKNEERKLKMRVADEVDSLKNALIIHGMTHLLSIDWNALRREVK